jgi:hypothetical protein
MELSRSDQRLLISKRQERQICWAGFDGFGAEDPQADIQPSISAAQVQTYIQLWPVCRGGPELDLRLVGRSGR